MKAVSRREFLAFVAGGAAAVPVLAACSWAPGRDAPGTRGGGGLPTLAGVKPGTILVDRPLAAEIRPTGSGPWRNRLLLATSPDGLAWTRTGVVLTNYADVPCAVIGADGVVRAYFVSFTEGATNKIVLASSRDLVKWSFDVTRITGAEAAGWSPPVDPTVVQLEDGRFRLYFTAGAPGRPVPCTHSAISEDGLNFALEAGVRFSASSEVLDPSVLRVRDGWALFAGGGNDPASPNRAGFSANGLDFETVNPPATGGMVLSNGVDTGSGYRYYGFKGEPGTPTWVGSMLSADGRTWNMEDGRRLEGAGDPALEATGAKDATVVKLRDGSYLMVYVSNLPGLPPATDLPPPPPGAPKP